MNKAIPSLLRPNHKSPLANHNFSLASAVPWIVLALLAVVSWNRWIEPYVDSGRELMVPRRLAQGERLWADVQFPHGPLGPYVAAIVEGAAGPSLPARIALCALVAAGHLAALQILARRWLSPWRAALALTVAIAAAVFLRPGGWLFPFSFDAAIAVAALTAAVAGATREPEPADAAAGAGVLAALLARPEIGLVGMAALAVAARRRPRRLVPLAVAPLAGAAAGYGMLSLGISRHTLVRDGWLAVLDPPVAFRNVYRAYAGLDRPALRLTELALAFVVIAVFASAIVAAASVAARLRASGRPRGAAAAEILLVLALAAAAAVAARPPASLAESLFLLPPLVRVVPLALIAAAGWRLARSLAGEPPRGALARVPDAALWLAAIFAARVLFAAGYVGPYPAFFLPLPLLVAQAGLFGAADRASASAGPALPRLLASALLVFALFRGLALSDFYRGRPWRRVATPAGSVMLPEPVGGATAGAIAALSSAPRGSTLAGFPEGGFFSYALARRNPFREEQFFPGTLDADGERRAIRVLETQPPDVLLLANVLAVGEGAPAFGQDYYRDLAAAARARYRPAAAFGPGARPGARIGDPEFFVEIDVPAATASGAR